MSRTDRGYYPKSSHTPHFKCTATVNVIVYQGYGESIQIHITAQKEVLVADTAHSSYLIACPDQIINDVIVMHHAPEWHAKQ